MTNLNNFGVLYIIATPIGNLQDVTLRAIETLKKVDLIAAEDTRHSQPFLQHYSISKPILSLHEHNERERAEKLIKELTEGKSIALISDAGTPLISDPGFFLVQKARDQGITIVPIPGACAAIAALSVSGLPTDRFVFEGFLPAKSSARLQRLNLLQTETRTMVFYESPRRVLDLLKDLQKTFGDDRKVVVARELTKMFETIFSGKLQEIIERVENDDNQQRGELVVLVAGADEVASHQAISSDLVLTELLKHLPLKEAVDIAVKITGERKNTLYQRALELKMS